MKTPKNYYTIIAAASIAVGGFIPASFGGEKEPSPQQVAVVNAKEDPVHSKINQTIVGPLNLQENLRSSFSRLRPTQSTSYHLVENTKTPVTGERRFDVMRKTTSYKKGSTPESKEFLKVRFVKETNETLVDLKGAWVKPAEHPILKMLPKRKPAKNITP